MCPGNETYLNITPPAATTAQTLWPTRVNIDRTIGFPAIMTVEVENDWLRLEDESETANPATRRAYGEFYDGGQCEFRGCVRERGTVQADGKQMITLEFLDKLQTLNETLATYPERLPINSVNTGAKRFTIAGRDLTQAFKAGYRFEVEDSTGNDRVYTVVSTTLSGTDSEIVVSEAVSSSTADGYILWPQSVFTVETPYETLDEVRLYPGHNYPDAEQNVWYPQYDSDAWLSSPGVTTTLGENLANSSTDLATVKAALNSHGGFPQTGFFQIDSEVFQYNGYEYKQSDSYWYFHNVKRVRLGSTQAGHTSGATITALISKRINDSVNIRIEGVDGTTYTGPELIARSFYKPMYESGGFAFTQDPLDLRRKHDGGGGVSDFGSIWAKTYGVYAEESADAISLTRLLNYVLKASPDFGGPGFYDGNANWRYTDSATVSISFSNIPGGDVKITRIQIDEPMSAFELIRRVLGDPNIALYKGTTNDAISLTYDAISDGVLVFTVAQLGAGEGYTFRGVRSISANRNTDELASMVVVPYETQGDVNLSAPLRSWHTRAYDDPGTGYPLAYHLYNGLWEHTGGGYSDYINIMAPNASQLWYKLQSEGVGASFIHDNDQNTGMALAWDSAPSPDFHFYFWWPGTDETHPDTYIIDEVVLAIEAKGTSDGTTQFGFETYSFDEFTGSQSTTPPTAGTAEYLDHRLCQLWTEGTLNEDTIKFSATNLGRACKAIGIKITGPLSAWTAVGTVNWVFALKEVYVRGRKIQHETVTLVPAYTSGNSSELVAPESEARLRNNSQGQHKVHVMANIGPATPIAARNLGWLQLLQLLANAEPKTYYMESAISFENGLPIMGRTATYPDGFSMVLTHLEYDYVRGLRTMSHEGINYNTTLFGASV